jgi:tRNA threonylcarbamoyladenosine biosynthesis protein TsaE
LSGDLGSGKTHFAKGFAKGLGITDMISSPTFILHRQYRTIREGAPLYFNHLDLYRIESGSGLDALGFDLDALCDKDQLTLIEWGDRILHLLPSDAYRLTFTQTGPEARRIEVSPAVALQD